MNIRHIRPVCAPCVRFRSHPDTVKRFTQLGIEAVGSTPQEYAAVIRASDKRYAEVVRVSGVRAD